MIIDSKIRMGSQLEPKPLFNTVAKTLNHVETFID